MADPAHVLEQMKAVVFAVRHITQDVETAQSIGKADDQQTPSSHIRSRAKIRVSATANNLITASKDFANSNGISPVSLLDAAASHLSAAIVELVRIVKVRPTPADELEVDDGVGDGDDLDAIMQSPTYFSVPSSLDRLSGNESVYSAISSPHSAQHSRMASAASGAGEHMQMHRKTFSNGQMLEKTGLDGVVQSIQALVSSIRAEPDDMSAIRVHIDTISSVVSRIISMTENVMAQEQLKQQKHPSTSNNDKNNSNNNTNTNNNNDSNSNDNSSDNSSNSSSKSSSSKSSSNSNNLRDRAGPIIRNLSYCRDRLAKEGAVCGKAMSVVEVRDVTGKLLPIAFEIARETKELVQRLDIRWV
ncbi:hypothetical protein PAAG_12094 [Paracoccidioides lutzii Pb01]|uniref:C3G9 VBS-like domain-containing protein n=1 Tax=Paracoccidioides lutzii (strain ATCC MYA-826 / Pb01) TaxID=502779 RepID=A0A0A2V0C8_PARBA|nr:hypothetical protein PAAG_12094 [Paracoccidioides lutzii Pb01]KGQ01236.1 hypothetical protein PAAG_12094 [Paracoccidioides lutzii Pb01]